MDQAIQDFIDGRRIAIVGAARDGRSFGNAVRAELVERGYEVFLVHPEAREIAGVECHPSLTALRGRVDGVLVCVAREKVPPVLREAAAIGLRNVWLQQGAESRETLALARELGLNLVAKRCVLMYAPPVKSLHAWHRTIASWFGQV